MTKTSRAIRLAAVPVAALLLLSACGSDSGAGEPLEVDSTDATSVAAAILVHAAHERFDEACEHSSDDLEDCRVHLQHAYERWSADDADPSLLEQAKSVQADDFAADDDIGETGGQLVWQGEADFADGKPWRPEVPSAEGGQIKVATHALQDGY